jgi:hypothetical protein
LFGILVGGSFTPFEIYCVNYQIAPQYLPIGTVRLISQSARFVCCWMLLMFFFYLFIYFFSFRRLCGIENISFFFFSLYSVVQYIARTSLQKKEGKKSKQSSTVTVTPINEMKTILQVF